jgi:high-affinity Fe2+/Pb2+ permease
MASSTSGERMQFRSRHSIEVVIAVVAGWLLYWALLAEQLVRRLHTFEAMFLAILLVAMLCTFAIVDLRWTVFREGVWILRPKPTQPLAARG